MILSRFRSLAETDRIACHDGKNALTFSDLWHRSEAIADHLLKNHPGKGVVAIFGDKENDMISAMLGAVKSGHPYVTLPSFYPEKRIADILADASVTVVLSPSPLPFPIEGVKVISAGDMQALFDTEVPEVPESAYDQPGDLVCILYTSGSTGKPKGVMIDYENIEAKIRVDAEMVAPTGAADGGATIQLASYAFSASLTSIYHMMLSAGWTVHCVPKEVLQDSSKLVTSMLSIQPNLFGCTPSLMERLLADDRFSEKTLPALEYVCFAGEALSYQIVRALRARFSSIIIRNAFGATEVTASPFFCTITDEMLETGEGFCPVETVGAGHGYLADEKGQMLTEDGSVGEIVLNYPTVSRGYLNTPSLTAERFFTTSDGVRAFKTGDIGEIKGGKIYCRGRRDNQVKIGGNRVELEEVEKHLRSVDIVKTAACSVKTLENGANILVGFVVSKPTDMTHTQAFLYIKKELKKRAESHMIPTKLIFVDSLPVNDNKKLDRLALKKAAEEA